MDGRLKDIQWDRHGVLEGILNYVKIPPMTCVAQPRWNKGSLFFLDSTALSVCKNWNISTHKVTKGFSSRGKTSKGWFLGFKLRGSCDAWGNLVNARFTSASVHDSQQAEPLTEGLSGLFVGDAQGIC